MNTNTENIRILIMRGGAIGDFIMTVPAITAVRERWPTAFLEIAGYPHIASLATACGLADNVVSLDKTDFAKLFSLNPQFSDEQIRYVRSFNIIISYLYDPWQTMKENIEKAGARGFIYGTPMVNTGHASKHFIKPLETLALYPEPDTAPALKLKSEILASGKIFTDKIGKNIAAIHPGSGGIKKNWKIDGFFEVAEKLAANGLTPVFVVGEADRLIANTIREALRPEPLISDLSLVELASFLSHCHCYIGNDSGVTHIAAAVGIPVVSLFGPSNPAIWGPRGKNVSIIYSPDDFNAITPDSVMESVLSVLKRMGVAL